MWLEAAILSLFGGSAIAIGGALAMHKSVFPSWMEEELRHSIVAIGGGALISAVCLVLIPDGLEKLDYHLTGPLAFLLGGISFMLLDRYLQQRGGHLAQLMAMLLDFIPEAIVIGAVISEQHDKALLMAVIIAAQNLPEGFNAYREIIAGNATVSRLKLLSGFILIALTGPLYALTGLFILHELPFMLGLLLMFGAGGIVYLTFQDVAPQARLERHWAPTMGAVIGFLIGLTGSVLIH